jgi:DNA-binding transcriptional MerR regulator
MNSKDKTYSIGAVSKMTGIEKHKMRHWTDRYLTHVQKIQVGEAQQRRFTEKDIKIIQRIDQLMKEGHTLKSAAEKSLNSFKEE